MRYLGRKCSKKGFWRMGVSIVLGILIKSIEAESYQRTPLHYSRCLVKVEKRGKIHNIERTLELKEEMIRNCIRINILIMI